MKKLKSLGQHFLHNDTVAAKIVDSLLLEEGKSVQVVEIGPGEGVLTQHLLDKPTIQLKVVEFDRRLPAILRKKFPALANNIIEKDVLKIDFKEYIQDSFHLIGNFPYNISSQILFKVLANKDQIPQMVGMFQKEVAERVAAEPNNKKYGILSVLIQAYYQVEYLFTVDKNEFTPPPKVQSGVLRLQRIHDFDDKVNYSKLKQVVKVGFNQRRKKLRNALKSLSLSTEKLQELSIEHLLQKRAEQLSVEDFIQLTYCL